MENGKIGCECEKEKIRLFDGDEPTPYEKAEWGMRSAEEGEKIPWQSDADCTKNAEAAYGRGSFSRRRKISAALTFSATILIAASLAVHTVLLAGSVKAFKKSGADILISAVLPGLKTEKKTPGNGGKEAKKAHGAKSEKGKADKIGENAKNTDSTKKNDTDNIMKGESPFINCDLSSKSELGLALMNETSYEPDLLALYGREKPLASGEKIREQYGADAPLVLIYHTHGTEAYAECAEGGFRSRDTAKNVVAVGKALSEALEKNGIKALHLTEMFDDADFSASYERSTRAVRKMLEKYPSVRYVLDIHRDYVDRDGDFVRCASVTGNTSYAQLMFVCGTDEGGSGHASWQDNLTVALQMQALLWQRDKKLMRAVDLKSASFYQDTSAGALIVEFGCCGNSLSDAKASADIFADALTEYINR